MLCCLLLFGSEAVLGALPGGGDALAIGIFLYYFIENGTLGLVPSKYYLVYRNIRISDLLLYGMTFYSLVRYKEYKDLFDSKPFLIAKLIILYFLFEKVL